MNHARFFVILIFVALWPAVGLCQSTSQYLSLPNDVVITQQTTVLQATLNLTQSTKVVVVSDGRYFQNVPNSVGYMRIDVDGAQSGNDSIIDWRGSVAPAQHSYNVIGYKTLGAGPHSIALIAGFIAGSYSIGAQSNLIVFLNPATQVFINSLLIDTARCSTTTGNLGTPCADANDCTANPGSICEFNFITDPLCPLQPPPPCGMADWGPQLTQNPLNTVPLLTRSFNPASQDIVALASGRAYRTSFGGDVLMNIYLDGSYKGQNASQWSDNDENEAAEVQAPLYSHAFFATPPSGIRTVSLNAMEFPYGFENPLRYRFGARTSLVVLSGGMTIKGAAPALQAPGCLSNDYIPIGPSIHCPDLRPLNTAYKIAERMIDFGQTARPVLLSAKTREQGGEGRSTNPACPCGNCCINEFGNVSLWITIDGVQKGSFGVQYLQSPAMCSQRTLTASYLATNLTGNHNVAVYAKADGSMCDINIQREIPLVWFD